MAKVSYANLKLKTNKTIKCFEFMGQEIEVLQYLPVEDKYDLIMITCQKAEENGIYNSLLLDMYFNLNLVYMYTNISFTEKQRENELKIYDALKSNGFFEGFFSAINEEEYQELLGYIEELVKDNLIYKNTAGAVIQSIIQDLPKNAQAAADIVNSFDKNKYQAVIDFVTAANGGRNIETNL
ncbi:hypothetical protein IJ384_07200 [bacterium]|nr:hypothetical protein [bacterium]